MSFLTGFDPTTGMFVLPLWTVGLAVALFGAFGVLAYIRTGRERLIAVWRRLRWCFSVRAFPYCSLMVDRVAICQRSAGRSTLARRNF